MTSPDYIMSEQMFINLSYVNGFNQHNGHTYQEHVLIIAGDRIPIHLHKDISDAPNAEEALRILSRNNIRFSHD